MAMKVLALSVLQADMNFLCLCSRLSSTVFQQGVTAELVSMDWSGAKMCFAIWQHSRVSLCLPKSCKHTTSSYRNVFKTEICQHNCPHLLWKASGQPHFYNPASANDSLLVYWPKDNIVSDDVSSDALWWEESARHSLHQTRQEGLLWDSDQN